MCSQQTHQAPSVWQAPRARPTGEVRKRSRQCLPCTPVSSPTSRTNSGTTSTLLNLHSGQPSESHFLFCSFGGFLKVGQFQTSLLLVSFHRNPAGRLCSQEAFHFLIFIRKTFFTMVNISITCSSSQINCSIYPSYRPFWAYRSLDWCKAQEHM